MNIFFFGDSIFFGEGVSHHKTFVSQISKKLELLEKELNVPLVVVNASVNGNTTLDALNRIHFDVLSRGVDFALIQFGMNDCNYWDTDRGHPRVNQKTFAANLNELIDRLLIFGVKKVFINTNHTSGKTKKFQKINLSHKQSNKIYNQIIRNVHTERARDVELIDIEREIDELLKVNGKDMESILQKDKLHLNESGHDLYFNLMYPRIKKSITETLRRSNK